MTSKLEISESIEMEQLLNDEKKIRMFNNEFSHFENGKVVENRMRSTLPCKCGAFDGMIRSGDIDDSNCAKIGDHSKVDPNAMIHMTSIVVIGDKGDYKVTCAECFKTTKSCKTIDEAIKNWNIER